METKEFNKRIYEIARMIPPGKVATYGQLAFMAGMPRGARMAGRAMKNAPLDLDIPCHRVVNAAGEMAPDHVFENRRHQRSMLEAEGVIFKSNGKINMKQCLWNP
ncbi:MAG: MGMT family protein [Clostridia bacterium]|nr:MGMT family protein [Clostridia bacterium]